VETVHQLASVIGERPAGSSGEHAAAEFLMRRLASAGFDVTLERFMFRGWRALAPALVELDHGEPIAAVPLPYAPPTGPGGVRGRLARAGDWPLIPGRLVCPRLAVSDRAGGALAAILVSPAGEARPLPNPQPLLALPTVVVGVLDGERLARLTESDPDVDVRVASPMAWEGPLESANLIADDGRATRAIAVIAHYDCVAGSCGANDNASGAALLVRLAQRFGRGQRGGVGFRFVLCGAEEPFLVGSRKHIGELAAAGALPRIVGCLNLDMVAVGERFSVRRSPGPPWEGVVEALEGHSPSGLPIGETGPMASSDQWAFHEAGIPSAQLTREPDPAWHSSEDVPERFLNEALDEAEQVAVDLLDEVAARCAGGTLTRAREAMA
jgi:hypothetical protein